MARRNKSSEPPVTLFSFQDIITSITGIMILVVLLLILNIIESKLSSRPADAQNAKSLADIRAQLDELRRKLAEEKAWKEENRKMLENAMNSDLDALPSMIDKESQRKKQLAKDNEDAARKIEEGVAKAKTVEASNKELDKKAEEQKEAVKELESVTDARLEELRESREEMRKKSEQEKKRIYFSFERQEGKEPLLVECSRNGIKVKIIRTGEIMEFADTSNSYVSIVNSFSDWIRNRSSAGGEYIVFTVKPSASGYINTLKGKITELKYQSGMEPVEEEMETVF